MVKTVEAFIDELQLHSPGKLVRFFTSGEQELIVADYDQDEDGNVTFLLCTSEMDNAKTNRK